MNFVDTHLLTSIVFLPVAAALAILAVPARWKTMIRLVSLAAIAAALALCAVAFARIDGTGDFELLELVPWIPAIGASYRLGVDGTSMLLMLLSAFLSAVSVVASWNEIQTRVKEFHVLLLVLCAGMLGTFAALDVLLFYVFWEVTLIPMYFIVGIWGSGDRIGIAIKFVLFTMAGSLLMLAAIIYAAGAAGSFDLVAWYSHRFGIAQQMWLFAAMALAFGIKVPAIGLHSWLPDTHAEAPTAGSILLAGVLIKMGAYGFYRFAMPLFPGAVVAFSQLLLVLAVTGVVVGALLALIQPDIKRLVAFSSVSHMGFVLLGLLALDADAAGGSILLMIGHGLTTGALFLLVGMLCGRRRSRMIADYGGSAKQLPLLATFFVFMSLSSMGLPGLANFGGEFLILLGSFQTRTAFAAVAVAGMVLMAACMLWTVQRVFFGRLASEKERLVFDIGFRECAMLVPIAAIIVAVGVWPQAVMSKAWRSAEAFVKLSKRVEMVVPVSKYEQK